jgi:hypothetical protein
MQNIKDSCIKFLYNEDSRKDIKAVLSPLGDIVYNEIYVYIWVICFYNIFLFIIILANLYLLLTILHFVREFKIYSNQIK